MIASPVKFPYGEAAEFDFNGPYPRSFDPNGYFCWTQKDDGLFDPTFTSENHKLPEDVGSRAYNSYNDARTVTVSGELHARDEAHWNAGAFAMSHALWDKDTHKLQWNILLPGSSTAVYLLARETQSLSMTDSVSQVDRVVGAWTVAFIADDPRIYKVSDDSLMFSWMV